MGLRRKPREPFPYVLKADEALPEAARPRFIVRPPTGKEFAVIMDEGAGELTRLYGCVERCVERLENHPDAEAFGPADSSQRRAYLDDMDVMVVRELGNVVGNTMLSGADLKN